MYPNNRYEFMLAGLWKVDAGIGWTWARRGVGQGVKYSSGQVVDRR
jgi:hypothetical protein